MTPASAAVTDWGWVTVAAGREADEGRPMTMAYPHHPRPVYNSGTSAASCSEASPNGNPCPIRTVIKPRLPSLSPRRCAMSGGRSADNYTATTTDTATGNCISITRWSR
ncbi:hypothetical protein PAHAL_5G044900 [Panicum hallii]|uniref:Uncharacterized protein n=1 Tax=Panicum hallii TaxID=206008 RepID=A0A2T8IIW5_9POAL|nr:hypothetical protein PAHAL_5G044900 [Panicum hallii]